MAPDLFTEMSRKPISRKLVHSTELPDV